MNAAAAPLRSLDGTRHFTQEIFMKALAYLVVLASSILGSPPAHAVDGCRVMLCITANWKNILQCRPDVEQAIHDVERGHGWPTCDDANGANYQRTTEATCPAFYSRYNPDNGAWASCQYDAILSVRVNNMPWSDTFWSMGGTDTSTRYYGPARAALGDSIDPRFDLDSAAWVPPPTAPVCAASGDSC
jgi:hypothetical protein